MPCKRVAERVGAQARQRRDRRGTDKAVEQKRNAMLACGECRTQDGGELAPAERGRDAQRIVEQICVTHQRAVDHGLFVRKARVVDPGAASGPAHATASEQCRRNRGRRRGVADAHLAKAEQIGLRPHHVETIANR
jgi:hypothetical protein